MVDAEPWATWLRASGGVTALYALLHQCPLAPDERAILACLLEHPGDTTAVYVRAAAVSRAAYFRKRARLLAVLAAYLNACAPVGVPSSAVCLGRIGACRHVAAGDHIISWARP